MNFWWAGKLLVYWEVSRALYIQDFELSLVTKTMGIKELKIVSKTGSAKQWKPYRIKNNKYKRSGRRLRVYGDSVAHATRWRRPNVAGGPSLGFVDVEWWRVATELSLSVGFGALLPALIVLLITVPVMTVKCISRSKVLLHYITTSLAEFYFSSTTRFSFYS